MFEKEVNTILEKEKNTIELINKLNEIYKPYDYSGSKKNDIFYIDVRIESIHSVQQKTIEQLKNLLIFNDLKFTYNYRETKENILNLIKKVDIDYFYYSVVYYFPYNNTKDYEITNMIYKENRVNTSKLKLILNCIWLLSHDEIMSDETAHKIYKLSKDGKTFIFDGCKVTRYKNQNLKIEFSNKDTFNKFQERFNKALKRAEGESKKNNC